MLRDIKLLYEEDPRFSGYLFEESYVLDLSVAERQIEFNLQLVLTPKHASYKEPSPGMRYCYRNGILFFRDILEKEIKNIDLTPTFDPDGSKDFGNIDYFSEDPRDHYKLGGSWGEMMIFALDVGVNLDASEAKDRLGEP